MINAVFLSKKDIETCHELALVIDAQEDAAGHQRRKPWKEGQVRPHFVGRLGELAVAYSLGSQYDYDPTYNKYRNDVDTWEVRSTMRHNGSLTTYSNDKSAPYVLVTLSEDFHTATIRGWLPLELCNVAEHYRDEWDCYFTPQSRLNKWDPFEVRQ